MFKKASLSPSATNDTSRSPIHEKTMIENMRPVGAYTALSELQALRYLAKKNPKPPTNKSQALLSGHHKSRAVNRGMEFEDVRPYQPGDDIRSIDWRVTARTQTTYSKRYSEEKERPIVTAVDQRRSLFFGSKGCFKSVYACHIAALINWLTLQTGDRSGGLVLGQTISETRPARSHKTVNRWLQQLCDANQQLSIQAHTEPTLSDFIERLIHSTQTGTQVYIISDFYDVDNAHERKKVEQRLFQLARHHSVTLIWIVDPLEANLPNAERITISNGQQITALALENSTKQKFNQQFLRKKHVLTELSQQLGVRFFHASTHIAPIDIAREVMG